MKKKVLSLFLAVLMIVSVIPMGTISASAVSESEVKTKLDSFISNYPSGSRWTGTFDGGSQCFGFGKMVIYNLFGKNSSGGYRSWNYAGVSTSGMKTIGSVTSFSASNVQSLLSKAKCGDVLQFDQTKQHTMIVYSVDSGGVTVYDCNWDNNCGISKRYSSFGAWSGRNSAKLTLLRADNYNPDPTPSHTVDTKYGKNFTAYPKAKITASNIFDANHNQISSTAWIGTTDKCTINEVYTDGCCKVTYPLDDGATKTAYSKISLFNTHTHNYSGARLHESEHPHAISQRCVDYDTCGGFIWTGETCLVTSCAKCSEIATYTLSASPSSLTMRVGETKSITFTESSSGFTVYMNGKYASSYLSNIEFGDWVDGCKKTLTFKAIKEGNTQIVVDLYSSLTDKVMKSVTVPITVLPDSFTVSYDANGGSPSFKETTDSDGKITITSKQPTKTGYSFSGWNTSANANNGSGILISGKTITLTQDMTLYAIWKANSYTIRYNANGGTGTMQDSSHTYDTAKSLTANGFTRTGYIFAGWSTDSSATATQYGDEASVKNLTSTNGATVNLYARWKPIDYTVVYNANGGTGTMSNSNYTYDTAKALSVNKFTKDGYKFLGWSKSSTATTPTYADGQSVKNLISTSGNVTLYAVWEKNPATVSSITVNTMPSKTAYTVGETFSSSGLSIKVNMSDSTSKTVTSGFTVSKPDMATAGTKTITVTYEGKTTTFPITVKTVDTNNPSIKIDAGKAACGQQIKIPVIVEKTELGTLTIDITYDSSKLKIASISEIPFDMYDTNTKTPGKIRITATDNTSISAGKVAVLTFDVIATSSCSTDISISVDEAYDANDNLVNLTVFNGVLEILKAVPGDVNGDGKVSAIDARMALQYNAGNKELTAEQKAAADVNGDGKVSAIDARWILQAVAGNREL